MRETPLGANEAGALLQRAVKNGRVHSGYLLTGAGEAPHEAAQAFARALVCAAGTGVPCEDCSGCHRSRDGADAEIVLDGKGKRGPTYRHLGDHPDLFWVERGADDTRITIRQIRDLQAALRLGANEGGRRCAVVAGAEWLNPQAQNALLHVLEEPPPLTSWVLVATRASALLATIRSRCVRIAFPAEASIPLRGDQAAEATATLIEFLDTAEAQSVGAALDLAESQRGARAEAAERVSHWLDVAGAWLVERTRARVERGERPATRTLDAHRALQQLRRELVQRNANPQMVAERMLLGLRDVARAEAG